MISVLCVDDDSAYLDITKRYLEEPGALTITTALSAYEAHNLMENNSSTTVLVVISGSPEWMASGYQKSFRWLTQISNIS